MGFQLSIPFAIYPSRFLSLLLRNHSQTHNTDTMGIVCSTCTHDAAELDDSIKGVKAPLLAPNPDAATDSYGSNAALDLAQHLAESEAEQVRAPRAQAHEEDRSSKAKTGGGALASSTEERRLKVERQGAKDRKVIEELREELEQARKDAKALQVELEQARTFSAGGAGVAVVGGGASPNRLLLDAGEQKVEAPGTVLARDVDSVPHVASDPPGTATDTLDHGTGTTTTMEGSYNKEICKAMWGELSESEGVKNFDALVHLWYRNLEEYATTGTVASGELPFAVQFCSQGWLPKVQPAQLKALRDHFCVIDKSKPEGQRLVIKEEELYATISSDKGQKALRDTTLKNLNFGRVRVMHTRLLC
jgi:hypothetical protein